MTYEQELSAIQTWIKSTTGLNSWKLKEAPSKLPRPVIIWDPPHRQKARDVSRYEYVMNVQQYGRLCVSSVEDAIRYQDSLTSSLEENCGTIVVKDGDGMIIRKLRKAQLEFNGDDLEGAFTLSYEVAYFRTRPADPPHATTISNKILTEDGGIIHG